MKSIAMFETFDNKIHNSQKDAIRHLETLHASKLGSISHQLVHIRKYTEIGDFIDENLHLFAEIQRIKDDMILSTIEDE